MSLTRRQRIAELLRHGRITVEELTHREGAPVKTILDDLAHIRRGLHAPERWIIHAAECLRCSYRFRERERLNTPSRCPGCKSEEIQDPEFEIGGAG